MGWSCGSQGTEHKARLTCSSLLSDGEESQGERSSTPRLSPRVQVSGSFSISAQPPSPAPGAPRGLGSQSLRRPRRQDRRTTCGWPSPPASGGCGGPSAVSPAPLPLPAPQTEPGRPSPAPRSPPGCRRTLPALEEPGSGFQILRADTEAPLVPSHRHPPEFFQGRGSPGSWSAAPLPAPGTPSLISPPPLGSSTSQGPSLSPQQQFEAG